MYLCSESVAPKRKKPRPVKYDDENASIFTVRYAPVSATTKAETDQPAKIETSESRNLEKSPGSAAENGGASYDLANPQPVLASPEAQPESAIKTERNLISDSKALTEQSEKDVGASKEEPPRSPKKESSILRLDDNYDDAKAIKA